MEELKSTEDKIKFITDFLKRNKSRYIDIENTEEVNRIYDLFATGKLEFANTSIECLYFGWYCHHILKDYNKMKMYYLEGIQKGELFCAANLGVFYKDTCKEDHHISKFLKYMDMASEKLYCASIDLGDYYYTIKDFTAMKKYYDKAITQGSVSVMINYSNYYSEMDDMENAIKYRVMAANTESNYDLEKYVKEIAINDLIFHYKKNKDYTNMIKYAEIAINEFKSRNAFYCYGHYHQNITKNYKEMKKYYDVSINMGCIKSMCKLAEHYRHIEKDYDYTEKLLLLSLEKDKESNNNDDKVYICCELAHFYQYVRKDMEKAIKFYELAINSESKNNKLAAIYNLGLLYQSEFCDYAKMKVYYDTIINSNDESDSYDYYFNLAISDMINHYTYVEKDNDKVKEYKDKINNYLTKKYKNIALLNKIVTTDIPKTVSDYGNSNTDLKAKLETKAKTIPSEYKTLNTKLDELLNSYGGYGYLGDNFIPDIYSKFLY